ncbi:MAG: hypothetical protein WCG83_03035 [Candidatus Peregrinibacteria bacterium]
MHIQESALGRLRTFAHIHDDLPSFRLGYLAFSVVVACILNVGAFALLVIAHASLDYVKYREFHGLSVQKTLKGIVHENLFDVVLLLIALCFGVYFHHTVGLFAISGMIRADLEAIRMLGMVIPKFEIAEEFFKVIGHLWSHLRTPHLRIKLPWSAGEKLQFLCIASCVVLLIFAPITLHLTGDTYASILANELIPWRM